MASESLPKRSAARRIKFTQDSLERLKPKAKPYPVYDSVTPGLCVIVYPSGTKSFFVYRKPEGTGTPVRVRICRFGELSLSGKGSVRERATEITADLTRGVNPVKERQQARAKAKVKGVTLEDAYKSYKKASRLADNTLAKYDQLMDDYLDDWKTEALADITGEMVLTKHKHLSNTSPTQANSAMRLLRAVVNFWNDLHKGKGYALLHNPVDILKTKSTSRGWNKETRRQAVIKQHEFKAWFDATESLPKSLQRGDGALMRDYLQFILLSGMRRREAASLQWENIDLDDKTFTVHDTKNKEPLTLPLSTQLAAILERRENADPDNPRPFPISEPKRAVAKVRELSGVNVDIHSLRRTFITVAESRDISPYVLKCLVNHKTGRQGDRDVTSGYIVLDIERMRGPMQVISDFIMTHAKPKPKKVTPIKKGVKA